MSRSRPGGLHALRRPRYAHHLVLLTLVGLALLPIYFMVINAFKTDGDYLTNQYGPPSPGTLDTLTDAFRGGEFFTWLKTTSFAGPIVQHHEYDHGQGVPMIAKMRQDLAVLQEWLGEASKQPRLIPPPRSAKIPASLRVLCREPHARPCRLANDPAVGGRSCRLFRRGRPPGD